MKSVYILISLTFVLCNNVVAQDPTYGDEFIKWVKKNTREFSIKLTQADYKTRLTGIHIAHYQEVTTNAVLARKLLDSLEKAMRLQEIELDKLNSLSKDSVEISVKRATYANDALNMLGNIQRRLESMQGAQQKIDSIGTKGSFVYSGLYHVGKENLLESVTDIGSSLNNNLVADYTIGVTYNEGENGQSTSPIGAAGTGTSAQISGGLLTGARIAIAYGPQFYPYAAALTVAAFIVGTDAVVRYNKKIVQQNEKVREALEIFEKLVPSADEMYGVYVAELNLNSETFNSQDIQLDSIIHQEYQVWKGLYKFNVYRLEASKLVLTKQKISSLQETFLNQNSVRKLFDARLLNTLSLDLDKQFSEILSLEKRTNNETDLFKRLVYQEEYSDALYEALAWYQELRNIPAFIPLFKKIEVMEEVAHTRMKAESSEKYLLSSKTYSFSFLRKFASQKKGLAVTTKTRTEDYINDIDSVIKKDYQNRELLYNRVSLNKKSIALFNLGHPQPYITYNAGVYSISTNNNGSFRDRYPIGGDIIYTILSGTFDGGYKTDARISSGVDKLNAATTNLNNRVEKLTSDYTAIHKIISQWQQESSLFNTSFIKSINEGLTASEDQFSTFRSANENAVNGIKEELQTFLTSNINTRSLETFIKQSGIYSLAATNVPTNHMRVNSSPILGQVLGNSAFPASNTALQNEIFREGYKAEIIQTEVSSRVARNIASRSTDPVFSSIDEYHGIKKLLSNSLRYARHFADSKNEVVNRLPMSSAEISNGYLHQAKLLRYYSMGLISEVEFKDFSIIDLDFLADEYKKLLIEFEHTCNVGNAGDALSPCNRFAAMALKSIYNVDDFLNVPTGDGQRVPFANSIYEYVGNNENWHRIGNASSQEANNAAALYAAEGRPVIAIQPNLSPGGSGHICIVLPGVPREGTGNPGYGPVLLPYVASWFIGHPEATFYYRKLSYAFGNGEGVVFFYRDLP